MEQLDRSRPVLSNRRLRPRVENRMAALSDLERNAVALTIADGEETYFISAERGPAGKVWLTCQCPDSQSGGWCRHRVDLLCFRYSAAKNLDAVSRRAFEQIVTGTALGDAGRDTDRSIKAFDECLRVFDEQRPASVVGHHLGKFADLVSDLAACAAELEDAIGSLRRLLERA